MLKFILYLSLSFSTLAVFSQAKNESVQDTSSTYKIIKTDGGELIGRILGQDAREVLFVTKDNRRFYIPQHTIKEIILLEAKDFNNNGEFVGEDKFATRYFITTNGLPIKKGEHYVQYNWFGPDFQFAVGENLGIGLMTSWIGIPLIGTIKKSWQVGEKAQFALGGLVATGSWAIPEFGGALPFAAFSFGDRQQNISLSAGYGALFFDGDREGRALASVAAMKKVSNKVSLVFDSFILLPGKTIIEPYEYTSTIYNPNTQQYEPTIISGTDITERRGVALIIPGIRWHQDSGSAFQFGFAGIINQSGAFPFPLPMIQWYKAL